MSTTATTTPAGGRPKGVGPAGSSLMCELALPSWAGGPTGVQVSGAGALARLLWAAWLAHEQGQREKPRHTWADDDLSQGWVIVHSVSPGIRERVAVFQQELDRAAAGGAPAGAEQGPGSFARRHTAWLEELIGDLREAAEQFKETLTAQSGPGAEPMWEAAPAAGAAAPPAPCGGSAPPCGGAAALARGGGPAPAPATDRAPCNGLLRAGGGGPPTRRPEEWSNGNALWSMAASSLVLASSLPPLLQTLPHCKGKHWLFESVFEANREAIPEVVACLEVQYYLARVLCAFSQSQGGLVQQFAGRLIEESSGPAGANQSSCLRGPGMLPLLRSGAELLLDLSRSKRPLRGHKLSEPRAELHGAGAPGAPAFRFRWLHTSSPWHDECEARSQRDGRPPSSVPVHFGKLSYLTLDADVARQLDAEWPSPDGIGSDVHDGRWRSTTIAAQRVGDALARSRQLQILMSAGVKVATVQRGAPAGLRLRCFPKGIEGDPAVANAGQVAQQFGMALWLGYPAALALNTLLDKAKDRHAQSKRPWATCRNPAAAFVLTICMLGWTIADGRTVTTDLGLEFDQARVSPSFSKELAEGHHQRAALHSVISGTALTQTRLYKRGMASDWVCLRCRAAPGTAWHRAFGGDGQPTFRRAEAFPELLRHAKVAREAGGNSAEMFIRRLIPSLDHVIPRRDPEGEFVRWHRRPASGFLAGLVFTDGSAVGTRWPELQRAGWSLMQRDSHGRMEAAAWGWAPLSMAPPQEARDGENYACHMAAFLRAGHVDFQTDCAATVACAQRGAARARRAGSSRAHLWNAFYTAFDDSRIYTVTKAPAHASAADAEADRITWWQRAGNRLADEAAKEGAKLALPDDQLALAFGLDLIARQAMLYYTGKLHAHMTDRKLLDHASDVILEFSEPEEANEEPEASGGQGAGISSVAAGAAAGTAGGHAIVERAITGPGTDGSTMVHCVKRHAYAHQRTQGILGPRGTGAGQEPQVERIRRGVFPNVKGGRDAWRLSEQFFPPEAWRVKLSARPPPSATPEASSATGSSQAGTAVRLSRERAPERFVVEPGQRRAYVEVGVLQGETALEVWRTCAASRTEPPVLHLVDEWAGELVGNTVSNMEAFSIVQSNFQDTSQRLWVCTNFCGGDGTAERFARDVNGKVVALKTLTECFGSKVRRSDLFPLFGGLPEAIGLSGNL
ncbi:unnamed protein product [Prorocentrum cordatum]|uniref:Uncharacterized protein n=1 Tax=Prorocentrum cordatum TaxID=2364126 RepID=A0ABN9TC80_9DINO|nr:unnamed protein product [Polarella glacialis]